MVDLMCSNKDNDPVKLPRKVVVQDPEEIYDAMMTPFEGSEELGDAVLDLETGCVIYSRVREGWDDEDVAEALANGQINAEDVTFAKKIFADSATLGRYLRIPEGETWWSSQDLTGFMETIEDPKLHARLARTIQGNGTFARFKNALNQAGKGCLDRWYAYKADIHQARVKEWLESEGIELKVDPGRIIRDTGH